MAPVEFLTPTEENHAKLLVSAAHKVKQYHEAQREASAWSTSCRADIQMGLEDSTVEEQKSRAKTLKELASLAEAWESYQTLRKVSLIERI